MHRHQIVGVVDDLVRSGKNIVIVVDRLGDVGPIIDEIARIDGTIRNAKLRITRRHSEERVEYADHWIRFVSARSPRGLRGLNGDVIVVDETSPGIKLSRPDIEVIVATGAERIPMAQ